jgi:hypothetical protein
LYHYKQDKSIAFVKKLHLEKCRQTSVDKEETDQKPIREKTEIIHRLARQT